MFRRHSSGPHCTHRHVPGWPSAGFSRPSPSTLDTACDPRHARTLKTLVNVSELNITSCRARISSTNRMRKNTGQRSLRALRFLIYIRANAEKHRIKQGIRAGDQKVAPGDRDDVRTKTLRGIEFVVLPKRRKYNAMCHTGSQCKHKDHPERDNEFRNCVVSKIGENSTTQDMENSNQQLGIPTDRIITTRQ